MYSIQETQDFYPLSLLYQERGLEVRTQKLENSQLRPPSSAVQGTSSWLTWR